MNSLSFRVLFSILILSYVNFLKTDSRLCALGFYSREHRCLVFFDVTPRSLFPRFRN